MCVKGACSTGPLTDSCLAMLNALIIEDERPAAESLMNALASVADTITITARLHSVRESIDYLSRKPAVDLIFSDIHLSDGLCFEIFKQDRIGIPVIFVTGNDEFIINAFECNGIYYLLKPVDTTHLHKAIAKYRMLRDHFNDDPAIGLLQRYISKREKKRLVVKTAAGYISLLLKDIVLFHSGDRGVYATDRLGQQYPVNKTLSELEHELEERKFFRASRQYILHIEFTRGFTNDGNGKIKVELTLPEINHSIIVSQEMAAPFREWIVNA